MKENVDGYDYDRAKRNGQRIVFKILSLGERGEIMRLPWLQWMSSEVKNRKPFSNPLLCIYTATNDN